MANIITNAKDIIVIDTSEAVGALSQLVRCFAGLSMSSVKTMTANVSAQVIKNQADIRGLRIMDHGNAQGCEIGNDFVTTANFFSYYNAFSQLTGAFCPYNGFAQMQHCLAGHNTPLPSPRRIDSCALEAAARSPRPGMERQARPRVESATAAALPMPVPRRRPLLWE